MRNVSIPRVLILAASIALAIAGCTRSSGEPPGAAPAAPGASAPEQAAALTCQPGFKQCVNCNGQPICARFCPECPPPIDGPATASAEPASLTCKPPLRQCVGCNGGLFCASRCPECAPQSAPGDEPVAPRGEPVPDTLALRPPSVESCGGTICRPGTSCCNPSCGICTPKGVNCTQQSCN